MFNLPSISIDRLSFWLGFAAACILWWLSGRIRPLLPQWRAWVRDYLDNLRQENLAGVEGMLRAEAVRKAQRQHLAAALFPLDEIVIQPLLLAPPSGQDPTNLQLAQSIASQVIPSIPDWPEILAPYGVPQFTLLEALRYGRNIAIIGQPGSGKSTALAYLACQIARQEDGKAPGSVPLYMHALDLNLDQESFEDPLAYILKELSTRAGVLHSVQLKQFLKAVLRDKHRKVIFLLDGLDELPPEQLTNFTKFLLVLHNEYPRLQTITTTSIDYLNGLINLGFYPLGIAAWTSQQRMAFAEKWGSLWNTLVVPELKKQAGYLEIDPALYNNWLSDETDYLSPLEWTLRIWGAYTGDLSGCNPITILDTHIGRFLPDRTYINPLEEIAQKLLQSDTAVIPFAEFDKIISRYKTPKPTASMAAEQSGTDGAHPPEQSKKPSSKMRRDISVSMGEQILNTLI
ncbi:MAG: ATP-binding protein, partial [Anaerolineaceae bacterium]|nr:ATP-binding protein [Anaerolineaceae bacterium]